jgi:tRNA (guanine-N7-)-methyltransferase
MNNGIKLRTVRSYVLREGHFTPAQMRAYQNLWSTYGYELALDSTLDPNNLFANVQPTYLEIGFGNGETLVHLATIYPERNFIGIEVHRPGIGHLLLNVHRLNLTNVRILRHDATEVIQATKFNSLAGVYILFPDPWPKTRHHKRRLIQPDFVTSVANVLQPNGFLHLATDWEDYAQWMLLTLNDCSHLINSNTAGGYISRPEYRNVTRFEMRGKKLGHEVRDLLFLKRHWFTPILTS